MNSRWNNDELLLAVKGVRKYGKDFQAIAELLGTKTEAQVRTFFASYRRKYNLDSIVREFEATNSQQQQQQQPEQQSSSDQPNSKNDPQLTNASNVSNNSKTSDDDVMEVSFLLVEYFDASSLKQKVENLCVLFCCI